MILRDKAAEVLCERANRPCESNRFIGDVAISLRDASATPLDAMLVGVLRHSLDFLNLDGAVLIQWGGDPVGHRPTYHCATRGQAGSVPTFQVTAIPWLRQQAVVGNVVTLSNPDELPPDAEADRACFRALGVRLLASVPMKLDGHVVGTLILFSQSGEARWPDDLSDRLDLIASVVSAPLGHSRRRHDSRERRQFELLLAEVSARFVSIAADQVDAAIEDVQRLICERLELDRSSLFQIAADAPEMLLLTHLHQPADGPRWQKRPAPSPLFRSYWVLTDTTPASYVSIDVKVLFPWAWEQLRNGRTVVMSSVDDLPVDASVDKASFRRYQTKSSVVTPLSVGGTWLGCLSFASVRQSRHWSEEQVRHLQFIADVFANALARRRADLTLRDHEERLQLATESADVGLWSMWVRSREMWVTGKTREILGIAPGEELTDTRLFAAVHPEDRAAVREAVQDSVETAADLRADCRIALPDGRIRWAIFRGRQRCDARGRPDRLTGVVIDITDRRRTEEELRHTLEELQRLQERLQQENSYLRKTVHSRHAESAIVGKSDSLMKVIRQAEQVSGTDATVLILGETGTGKELLAQYIHRISGRASQPFVATSVAAIPATLLESELFGREKGAYTGALTKEIGRFELASGGTLFLDEVGDMPMETQTKLLRVLQTGELERLGSGRTLCVDVRVIAATNRDLPALINAGQFREDLFYRLNVFPITLPPLRYRREDIRSLVWALVTELSGKMGKPVERIPEEDFDALEAYDWPGNVRELRNVIERSLILMEGVELRVVLPGGRGQNAGPSSRRLVEVERRHILDVLESTDNRIYGTGGAAEVLGIKPTTLYSLMARLKIERRR